MKGGPFALAAAVALSHAAAAAGDAVPLELRACPALSEGALREHVELELKTLQLAAAEARLLVRCERGVAVIELTTAGARYPVTVRVELRDTAPRARERLVALAATELLAQAERAGASEPPLLAPAPSAASASAAPGGDVPPISLPVAPRRVELFLAGSAARAGSPSTWLGGGVLGGRVALGADWWLLLDTRFERGAAAVPLARVRWSSLSGLAGAAAQFGAGPWRLSAGPGLRAGWLALDAAAQAPHDGRSLTAPWAAAVFPVRVAAELAGGIVPFAGAEGGYVLLPVRGVLDDGAALIEQRGLWLSAFAGVGVLL